MKPKVLFIEDDPNQVDLYKTKFELEGFDFSYAENGADGMLAAKKKKPKLIFLDILLPDENGLEILKKLKNDEVTKGIPTILFTNLSDKISRDEGIKMGAVDFFVKTDITLSDLVDCARKYVSRP